MKKTNIISFKIDHDADWFPVGTEFEIVDINYEGIKGASVSLFFDNFDLDMYWGGREMRWNASMFFNRTEMTKIYEILLHRREVKGDLLEKLMRMDNDQIRHHFRGNTLGNKFGL